jgi:hypothetical protein
MQDYSLDRFSELLGNLKAQKEGEKQEGDERAVAFNEARGGRTEGMMDNMM